MFCRINVAGENINRETLLTSIVTLLNAQLINYNYIERHGFSLEIRPNDDYNEKKAGIFPDGFLYFPWSIEIEIEEYIPVQEAASEITKVLQFLWMEGYAAVASCQFEDLLAEKGGYKSKNIPWLPV